MSESETYIHRNLCRLDYQSEKKTYQKLTVNKPK